MKVFPTPHFVRMFDALEREIQEDALERIEQFRDRASHKTLRVHKLHGKFKDCYAFSVSHRIRIVFQYASKTRDTVYLLAIGDHAVYQ